MEPSHIPVTNLCKADLMRTELLIRAHQKQLAQCVKQLYNMDLHMTTSAQKGCKLVQFIMESPIFLRFSIFAFLSLSNGHFNRNIDHSSLLSTFHFECGIFHFKKKFLIYFLVSQKALWKILACCRKCYGKCYGK